MNENFDGLVLPFTLTFEGGRADDPRDPGGRTNQGITQATYTAYRKASGQAPADVFAMTADERNAIYRVRYWSVLKGDTLPSGVDLACFDLGVNSGPARAKAYLAAVGGPAKALADPAATVRAICARRLSFLHALRTFETFGRGWTARVAACEALGVKMALHARAGLPVAAPPTKGTALVLRSEARRAGTRAASQSKAATGAAAGLGAGAATPALPSGMHLPWLPLVLVGLVLGAAAAALAWRAFQHRTRAAAYTAAAQSA